MSEFDESVYTYGEAPTISVWTPNTEITLCRVPWSADYRDIVYFNNQSDLDAYIDAQPSTLKHQFKKTAVVTPGQPIKVDLEFSSTYFYNYVRVKNYAQPGIYPAGENPGSAGILPRTYYYFINDIQFSAPNVTALSVQLDVWQTFGRFVTFGNCYVERGHIGIANSAQFDNQGRDYLTVPEGLDVGDEYWIKNVFSHTIANARTDNLSVPFGVLVASTLDLLASGGTVDKPVIMSGIGSGVENIPNGLSLYYFPTVDDYRNFLADLTDTPWIGQSIISTYIIPANLLPYGGLTGNTKIDKGSYSFYEMRTGDTPTTEITMKTGWRSEITPTGRYKNLKKFMTFPYALVELTTNTGTPLVLKPEAMQDDDLVVVQASHVVPPDPRIGFYCRDYNKGNGLVSRDSNGQLLNDIGEHYDMMTGISNFPQFSVVNDGYMNYMAANRNTIAYQYSSADWSQQRALAGNQLSYNQSSYGMGTASALTGMTNEATQQRNTLANETLAYQSLQSGANGIVNGIAMGGAPGVFNAAMGAANAAASYAIGANQNNQSTAITTQLNSSRNRAVVGQMGYNRDTNKSYADWAAKGDYENEIRAINARVRDARMIQPTTSGQVGGDAFNLTTIGWVLMAKVKTIDNATMRNIGEFWLRYGYAINAFISMPSNFQVMDKFTYWKLRETYIISAYCPEGYKHTLRGIFEKGVTVWARPEYIGAIDIADNNPLSGVSY